VSSTSEAGEFTQERHDRTQAGEGRICKRIRYKATDISHRLHYAVGSNTILRLLMYDTSLHNECS